MSPRFSPERLFAAFILVATLFTGAFVATRVMWMNFAPGTAATMAAPQQAELRHTGSQVLP